MSQITQTTAPERQTEHPHIVRMVTAGGDRFVIRGTRISVRHIAEYYKAGDTVDEILQSHPHLSAASVYDAISYYLDHQSDIEKEIAANRLESLTKKYQLKLDKKGFVSFSESLLRG